MKMNIWLVNYDYNFSSTSNMKPYTNEYKDKENYILTDIEKDSINDVKEKLQQALGNQCSLTINTCKFLGRSYI